MASTTGGFLIGFGIAIFFISSIVFLQFWSHYQEIREATQVVQEIYGVTHSLVYVASMQALKEISPADQVALSIRYVPNIGWLSSYLEEIPRIY